MKKMLMVTSALGGGGAERVLSILANYFDENNYRVEVVSLVSNRSEYMTNPKITNHFIGDSKNKWVKAIMRYTKLRNIIQSFKPDVIVSFGAEINMYAILAKGKYNCPIVISERNDPNISPNSKFIRKIRDILYKKVDHIVFQTLDARKYFNYISEKKCSIIANPVMDGLPKYNPNLDKPFIFSAGRLNKQKNFPLLIEAFASFNKSFGNYKLIIAGEGPEYNNLFNLAKKFNIENNIEFIGFTKEVHKYMKECSMFVLTSNYEGMSNVMLESLAIGVPTICTDCPIGGARMVINDGKNGVLIPVNDKQYLIKVMKYIASNPDVAGNMGREAAKSSEKYSSDRIKNEWNKLISRYLGVEK